VPETFITTLVAFAAWAAITSRFALTGLAIGIATIFKPTALVYWPVFALFASLSPEARWPSETRSAKDRSANGEAWTSVLQSIVVSGAMLLIPIAAVLLWLWSAGALTDARIAVIDYNRAYAVAGSSWLALPDRLAHEIWRLVKTDPLWCAAALAGVVSIVPVLRALRTHGRSTDHAPRPTDLPLLAILWLAGAIAAAGANGLRMYATYFLPAAPPLALLVGSLFDTPSKTRRLLNAAVVVLAGIVAVKSHYPDRLVRYTRADVAQLRGTEARASYLEMFGGYGNRHGYSARANEELTTYVRAHSTPDDRVYIFGMAPAVYFDAARLPANRFIWTFPAVAPFAGNAAFTVDALAASLERAAPRYVVLERNNRDSSTGWRIEDVYESPRIRRVLDAYMREIDIEDFTVLRRR
jgi:hypothetical protein